MHANADTTNNTLHKLSLKLEGPINKSSHMPYVSLGRQERTK